jgi:uncharacterized protein (TIGR04255 family)
LKLANPPIVEVGIGFQFEPDPEKQPWDLPVAVPFVELFKDSMPYLEVVKNEEIRIEKRSPQGVPEVISGKSSLDHVRAHDEEERQWLEAGNDRMAYRLLRGGKEYPGFESVLEKALEILGRYVQHFRPTAVRRAILNYLDIVKVPAPAGEAIELEDYFQLGVKLPEDPFGPIGEFATQFILPATPGADRLHLAFMTEHKREHGNLGFQMRWQSICDGIGTLDGDVLRHRLTSAHEHLAKCFRACFTSRGLGLFGGTDLE